MNQESSPERPESSHEMPPLGASPLAWGFAGVFLIPVVLIVMIFVTPMCSSPPGDGSENPLRLPRNIPQVDSQPVSTTGAVSD